ncbi:MAG TPA: PepSY-like domain-containing protein [Tepidisphaeraceae bacterium]|nr:PepSY-like domain-containing protein [Tepidisphaeraceae bacterium]
MKRELLALSLALCVAAPVLAEDKPKDDTKHEHKHDKKDKSEKIKAEDLPAKVMTAFKNLYPNATITEVEKETKDGKVEYEIEFKDADGKEHDVEFNAEGEKIDD